MLSLVYGTLRVIVQGYLQYLPEADLQPHEDGQLPAVPAVKHIQGIQLPESNIYKVYSYQSQTYTRYIATKVKQIQGIQLPVLIALQISPGLASAVIGNKINKGRFISVDLILLLVDIPRKLSGYWISFD